METGGRGARQPKLFAAKVHLQRLRTSGLAEWHLEEVPSPLTKGTTLRKSGLGATANVAAERNQLIHTRVWFAAAMCPMKFALKEGHMVYR